MSEKIKSPPRLAKWLFRHMSKYQEDYSIAGDVEEVFFVISREDGHLKACLWYWYQCLMSLFLYWLYLIKWRTVMLRNYFKIAFRTYFRNPGTTLINLSGLAIGIAAFILIILYVSYEQSYDKFHSNYKDIYRVQHNVFQSGNLTSAQASTVPAISPALKRNFSEVTDYAMATDQFLEYSAFTYSDDVSFRADRIYVVTPSFLTMFNFPLIRGDAETALSEPLKAVLTETIARQNFGDEDPVGKIINYNSRYDFEITGVCQDVPKNSHIKFDVLLSFKSLPYTAPRGAGQGEVETNWNWSGFYSYVTLRSGIDPQDFQAKINSWLIETKKDDWAQNHKEEFLLQPLQDIHLFSSLVGEIEPEEQGNEDAIRLLEIIALFILFLAWINYINITTSRALERAKEVGIRKVSGAFRKELIKQFFLEYLGIILVAVFLAFLIVLSAIPHLNVVTGAELSFRFLWQSSLFWRLFWLFGAGSVIVGIYPAMTMSAYNPVTVLKSRLKGSTSSIRFRKFLVTLQLTVSVALIAGTFIVYQQLFFMLNKDIGIDIDQTLVLHGPGTNMAPPSIYTDNFGNFRNDIQQHSRIKNIATTTSVPGEEILWGGWISKLEDDPSQAFSIRLVGIDTNFIPSLGITLRGGRNFSSEFISDMEAVILNEAAIAALGYESPEAAVNKKVRMRGRGLPIIGVIADYDQISLKAATPPLCYRLRPNIGYVTLKIDTQNLFQTMAWLKSRWREHFPGMPFDYFFLDESYNRHYINDLRFSRIFALFTVLLIIIACLGLFALANLNAVQRTKEIGVRKAMGASVSNIYTLLSGEFLKLVGIASVIAIPLIYFQMHKWLQNFAYRTPIRWWFFVAAWAVVSAVVMLTISYQTFRAAKAKPVDALRYE